MGGFFHQAKISCIFFRILAHTLIDPLGSDCVYKKNFYKIKGSECDEGCCFY